MALALPCPLTCECHWCWAHQGCTTQVYPFFSPAQLLSRSLLSSPAVVTQLLNSSRSPCKTCALPLPLPLLRELADAKKHPKKPPFCGT